jgi:hypothetical protein
MIEVIYVRGGDKTAPNIAESAGMQYGIRHDYKPYAPVWMLDIKWDDYDWQHYLSLIRDYQPVMALVPDYERPEQRDTLLAQIDELRPLVERVLVCPKWHGAVAHIPEDCVIALSVPAPSYAGFLPDLRTLVNRKIHLLGGKPALQVELITKLNALGANVLSVDGSYIAMKAGNGQVFREGAWVQSRWRMSADWQLCELSAQNYVKFIQTAIGVKQPLLGL